MATFGFSEEQFERIRELNKQGENNMRNFGFTLYDPNSLFKDFKFGDLDKIFERPPERWVKTTTPKN